MENLKSPGQHLAWAKKRALEMIDDNSSIMDIWKSFVADMMKHHKLREHSGLNVGTQLMVSGKWKNQSDVINFINGFN